jgi:hypothetical protein
MKAWQPTFEYVRLTGLVKSHHKTIQALFGRYLVSPLPSRSALAEEILVRLRSHLAIEDEVLLTVIRNYGPQGLDLIQRNTKTFKPCFSSSKPTLRKANAGTRYSKI